MYVNPAERRRELNVKRGSFGICSPICALVNPRAQHADLLRRQRITLAGWRHFHVGYLSRDIIYQKTFFAVAGNDVVGVVVAAIERRLAAVEAEIAARF